MIKNALPLHYKFKPINNIQGNIFFRITLNIIRDEPGFNDIGFIDTSSIASDILWYQLIPRR